MKRVIAVAIFAIALPFTTAAECYYGGGHHLPPSPSPSPSEHCLMDKNGCVPSPNSK